MTTYSAWFKAYQADKGIRQITYICGIEQILQQDVRRRVLEAVGLQWHHPIVATGSNERAIWEQLDRRPFGNSTTCTVIYEAQRLQDTERFTRWWKNRRYNPHHYVILISAEEAAPRQPVGDPKEHKTEVVDHLRFGSAGWLIECKPFTQATVKTAVAWVRTITPMTEAVAAHLLNRADGNLRLVRDTAEKLAVFPGTITQSVVNDLLSEQPRDSFVDALLAMDKKTALAALDRMPKEDFSRAVGLLDSSLELAGMVHDFQMNQRPRFELIKAAGKRAWLLPDIEKVSKHYDSKRRTRTRQLLLMADEVIARGETRGVLEAVTALW